MKFDCLFLTEPKDITSQCNYKDEFPRGRRDKDLVSCCQGNGSSYNELEHFYRKNFSSEFGRNYGEEILQSMCECCEEKGEEEWKWERYKKCVREKLRNKGLKWEES